MGGRWVAEALLQRLVWQLWYACRLWWAALRTPADVFSLLNRDG